MASDNAITYTAARRDIPLSLTVFVEALPSTLVNRSRLLYFDFAGLVILTVGKKVLGLADFWGKNPGDITCSAGKT